MERIIKLFFILIISLCPLSSIANTTTAVPQKAELSNCIKTFPVGYEKLFYLTLAGINEYDFVINEIQSKSGYIGFTANKHKYLATIVYVSSQKSMLKVTSYDGKYDFTTDIPNKLFKYVEIYQETGF